MTRDKSKATSLENFFASALVCHDSNTLPLTSKDCRLNSTKMTKQNYYYIALNQKSLSRFEHLIQCFDSCSSSARRNVTIVFRSPECQIQRRVRICYICTRLLVSNSNLSHIRI